MESTSASIAWLIASARPTGEPVSDRASQPPFASGKDRTDGPERKGPPALSRRDRHFSRPCDRRLPSGFAVPAVVVARRLRLKRRAF